MLRGCPSCTICGVVETTSDRAGRRDDARELRGRGLRAPTGQPENPRTQRHGGDREPPLRRRPGGLHQGRGAAARRRDLLLRRRRRRVHARPERGRAVPLRVRAGDQPRLPAGDTLARRSPLSRRTSGRSDCRLRKRAGARAVRRRAAGAARRLAQGAGAAASLSGGALAALHGAVRGVHRRAAGPSRRGAARSRLRARRRRARRLPAAADRRRALYARSVRQHHAAGGLVGGRVRRPHPRPARRRAPGA